MTINISIGKWVAIILTDLSILVAIKGCYTSPARTETIQLDQQLKNKGQTEAEKRQQEKLAQQRKERYLAWFKTLSPEQRELIRQQHEAKENQRINEIIMNAPPIFFSHEVFAEPEKTSSDQ